MIAPQPQRFWPLLLLVLTIATVLGAGVGIAVLGGGAG